MVNPRIILTGERMEYALASQDMIAYRTLLGSKEYECIKGEAFEWLSKEDKEYLKRTLPSFPKEECDGVKCRKDLSFGKHLTNKEYEEYRAKLHHKKHQEYEKYWEERNKKCAMSNRRVSY